MLVSARKIQNYACTATWQVVLQKFIFPNRIAKVIAQVIEEAPNQSLCRSRFSFGFDTMHHLIFMHPESGTETAQQQKEGLATGARKPDFLVSNENLEYDFSQNYVNKKI